MLRWVRLLLSPRYEGLLDRTPTQDYVVIYPDGNRTIAMPYGNAEDYRDIFGGCIVHVNELETPSA